MHILSLRDRQTQSQIRPIENVRFFPIICAQAVYCVCCCGISNFLTGLARARPSRRDALEKGLPLAQLENKVPNGQFLGLCLFSMLLLLFLIQVEVLLSMAHDRIVAN